MALRLRRGTEAERQLITPDAGELIYVTDTKAVWVGDGATLGGVAVTTAGNSFSGLVEVKDDTTPQLGGNLDLNNFSIVGIGEINIDGNIYATGNIQLGLGNDGDIITINGNISGSLIPSSPNSFNLGSVDNPWRDLFASGIDVSGESTLNTIKLSGDILGADSSVIYNNTTKTLALNDLLLDGNIIRQDSSYIFDATSETLNVNNILANSISGNFIGSVFGNDSRTMIDGINGLVIGDVTNGFVITQRLEIGPSLGAGVTITTEQSGDDDFDLLSVNSFHDADVSSGINFFRARGTVLAPTPLLDNDEIFSVSFSAETQAGPAPVAAIFVNVDGTVTANGTPAAVAIATSDDQGIVSENVVFSSSKSSTFFGAVELATYPTNTDRDTAIPAPNPGSVVFVLDGDGGGTPQFQGYNGIAWVVLA